MDLTTTPDTDNDTPPHILPIKRLSFTNGTLKKHHYLHHQPPYAVVTYKECLKNHAASLGGHALDGCGEFMPSPTANPTDPTSLKCAACGCHRNFHRCESSDDYSTPTALITPHFLDFRQPRRSSPSPSPSPPPRRRPPQHPSSATNCAPHMLLALSGAANEEYHHQVARPLTPTAAKAENLSGRKRFRTRFTQEQKEQMHAFSEKLGWKMQKCDEAVVEDFCNEIGVARGVLKVWMHNNKNSFGKRDINNTTIANSNNNNRVIFENGCNINSSCSNDDNNNNNASHCQNESGAVHPSGSSPSS